MFEEVKIVNSSRRRIGRNEISINHNFTEKSQNCTITFNKEMTDIVKQGNYSRVRVLKDNTSRVIRFVLCNNVDGTAALGWSDRDKTNAVIRNKDLTFEFVRFFELPKTGRTTLTVTQLDANMFDITSPFAPMNLF